MNPAASSRKIRSWIGNLSFVDITTGVVAGFFFYRVGQAHRELTTEHAVAEKGIAEDEVVAPGV